MQVCDVCGACRENEWKVCPFCRADLHTIDSPQADETERFDALAAAAETTDMAVLPSLVLADEEPEEELDLITAQDLAHLTGDGGPAANSWDSPSVSAPPPPPQEQPAGIDAPVSKALVFPLIGVALAAVAFVAYSIVTASPSVRPEAVALIDVTTTTEVQTTTGATIAERTIGTIGIDLAEQASQLCAGEQFSIARAASPSLATHNDLVVATRDGREAWDTAEDQLTLRTSVPSLVACLTTADGGEIDRCPTDGYAISRRSVTWTYRVLRTIDGAELGSDSDTAETVRPCEELAAEAGGEDLGSWSELPQERLALVAAEYTSAPHPQTACVSGETTEAQSALQATTKGTTTPEPLLEGLSLHATFDGTTDVDVTLPSGWMATDDRPVEAVLCLTHLSDAPRAEEDATPGEAEDPVSTDEAVETNKSCTVRVHARLRDGSDLGSWDYVTSECPEIGEHIMPPEDWWLEVVGPALGYVEAPEDDTTEGDGSEGVSGE